MGQPASASSVVTVPEQASATSAATMASSRSASPSTTDAANGQPAMRSRTASATLGAVTTATCSAGCEALSRATASSNGGISRAISPGRLPGRTSSKGPSGDTPSFDRRRAPSAAAKLLDRVGLPTAVVGSPPASNTGASKAWMVSSRSTVAASVRARPGREAHTCGPTYFTSGMSGLCLRSRLATRRVKPQESISTATSGRSLVASAAVSSARRTTRG